MNIPARYCTGYLGDIGVPPDPAPMDFSAWFEAYLDGQWYTFDARHNHPRIGRIVIARGRDAADVAISTAFGPAQLARFAVITEQLLDEKCQQAAWCLPETLERSDGEEKGEKERRNALKPLAHGEEVGSEKAQS
jgi:transglutaminase-like putative cysteine protease